MSALDDTRKTWYRHVVTGDRGYLVTVDGVEMIRLDRPQEEIYKPLRGGQWTVDRDFRPLTVHQTAQVAFEAHRALCRFLGFHDQARRTWMDLKDEERRAWVNGEDVEPKICDIQRQAIMDALKVLTA